MQMKGAPTTLTASSATNVKPRGVTLTRIAVTYLVCVCSVVSAPAVWAARFYAARGQAQKHRGTKRLDTRLIKTSTFSTLA